MSLPNIPDITPKIDVTTEKAANMLLSSIALEGLGLSHIINAEGEKIQYILGTLHTNRKSESDECICIEDILKINKSIDKTLSGIIKNQILLQLKLENTLDLFEKVHDDSECDECEEYYDELDLESIINEELNNEKNDNLGESVECKPSYFDDGDE